MIRRALLSVWNKDGILDLAKFLEDKNIEIISTGGTKKILEENNIKVRSVSDITGMDSVMDGRVKTLDPKIFGGILADRKQIHHLNDLSSIGGLEIDLVVVNFYPFEENAIKESLDLDKAIEFIDIGGPSMLRAAAKNHNSVIPLSNPNSYELFKNLFEKNNGIIPKNDRLIFLDIYKQIPLLNIGIYYRIIESLQLDNTIAKVALGDVEIQPTSKIEIRSNNQLF